MDGVQIDPNVWGPPLWDMLFTFTFKSKAKVSTFQTLFVLLDKIIPCQHCRRNYTIYRKQVQPTTFVRDGTSACQWLWTIHDMVNQKLGKICISFDALQKRHKSTMMLTNDFVIVDLLAMMERSVSAAYIRQFARICMKLSADCPGLHMHRLGDGLFEVDESLADDVYTTHIRLCEFHGIDPNSRDVFDARIASSFA